MLLSSVSGYFFEIIFFNYIVQVQAKKGGGKALWVRILADVTEDRLSENEILELLDTDYKQLSLLCSKK